MAESLRILTIDGGGMRGMIPVCVLAEIERRAGKPIASLFDLIVGTSTGGILALGLTRSIGGSPALTASELMAFYTRDGRTIFPPGGSGKLWDQLRNSAQRVGSTFGGNKRFAGSARYFPDGLERVLKAAFGESRLSEVSVPVLLTTFDSISGTSVVLSSDDARRDPSKDIRMWEAARATSAAPTFFPPMVTTWNGAARAFVDGGIWANNPSSVALAESMSLTSSRNATATSVLLVSLGTGSPPQSSMFDPGKPWTSTLADLVALGTSTDDAHRLAERALRVSGETRYWRLQTQIGGSMDDAAPARLAELQSAAERLIRERSEDLDSVVRRLSA